MISLMLNFSQAVIDSKASVLEVIAFALCLTITVQLTTASAMLRWSQLNSKS